MLIRVRNIGVNVCKEITLEIPNLKVSLKQTTLYFPITSSSVLSLHMVSKMMTAMMLRSTSPAAMAIHPSIHALLHQCYRVSFSYDESNIETIFESIKCEDAITLFFPSFSLIFSHTLHSMFILPLIIQKPRHGSVRFRYADAASFGLLGFFE